MRKEKEEIRGGIASRRIKYLTHPLERSIAAFFVITLFFTLLALISGIPVIVALSLLIPPSILVKKLFACQIRSLTENMSHISPLEAYWMCDNVTNNNKQGISTCLLYLDKGLSIQQLRDVLMTRILQRPEMARFRSILVRKECELKSIKI
ncbi:hypothetical protein B4U80_00310 [Leptotrombidium deliense]|uniref:Uncharacterized protein n=1 Tax=Leptotrombidium deliense TaxID=299467 RepID=A0A443SKC6_9ACAR|nr:hypothetical protein B4U80_00310 [Leptotrombidium deliense]